MQNGRQTLRQLQSSVPRAEYAAATADRHSCCWRDQLARLIMLRMLAPKLDRRSEICCMAVWWSLLMPLPYSSRSCHTSMLNK